MKFYRVSEEYLKYLRTFEENIMYGKDRYLGYQKFIVGVVLEINSIEYYAPLSSIKTHQLDRNGGLIKTLRQKCFPVRLKERDNSEKIVSILRLDYMFPAPKNELFELCFTEVEDRKYKIFLETEYKYIKKHKDEILERAQRLYKKISNPEHFLASQCCNFRKLEKKYKEWILKK